MTEPAVVARDEAALPVVRSEGSEPGTTVDLVLSGGGAAGLMQAYILAGLEERGYRFRRAIGTSVGAIAAAAVKTMGPKKYVEMFEAMSTRDVMRKPWWDALAYAGLTKHTGLYSWSPLRNKLKEHLPAEPIPDAWVTRVDAVTEQLEIVPATAETVFQSALMPLVGRFDTHYDGGVREQIPLGTGLDVGIGAEYPEHGGAVRGNGVMVVIVMCSPYWEQPAKPHDVKDGLQAGRSVIGAMMREGRATDLREFLKINWLCQQLGGSVPRPGGGTYSYYPVEIWAPGTDLGDAMDFDSAELKALRRQEAVYALERGPITDPFTAAA